MAIAAKEAFWKEHQDSLIRIRSQLSTHGKNSPAIRRTPLSQGRKTRPRSNNSHPPLGKYRRTPPPYLPEVDNPATKGHHTPPLRGNKFEVVPPVRPKQAFARSKPDYDSWGEESDDDDDDDDDEGKRGRYKPKPYPQPSPMMMGAPFSMYYPPPPKGNRRRKERKLAGSRGYRDIHRDRQAYRGKKDKRGKAAPSMPFFMPMPMMPMMMPVDGKYKYIYGEEESSEDEMPYDHPAYLATLYCCEDVMEEGLREILEDVTREVTHQMAADYLDEKQLQRDPLEDFLSSLLDDAVRASLRDVVRESVFDMAQQHLEDETATAIYNDIFQEELKRIVPGLLDDVQFDVIAEEFIEQEIVATEVEEEAEDVATEMLHHYDNKITQRELKEVTKKANGQLADSLLMEYMMSVISRQGKIWTQDDYSNRYLDDLILAVSMEQYYLVQKDRDKTLDNKPLRKLHEKAFTEVALDVCLQQLTSSLDEDLADVDEYERGVMDEAGHSISLSES